MNKCCIFNIARTFNCVAKAYGSKKSSKIKISENQIISGTPWALGWTFFKKSY